MSVATLQQVTMTFECRGPPLPSDVNDLCGSTLISSKKKGHDENGNVIHRRPSKMDHSSVSEGKNNPDSTMEQGPEYDLADVIDQLTLTSVDDEEDDDDKCLPSQFPSIGSSPTGSEDLSSDVDPDGAPVCSEEREIQSIAEYLVGPQSESLIGLEMATSDPSLYQQVEELLRSSEASVTLNSLLVTAGATLSGSETSTNMMSSSHVRAPTLPGEVGTPEPVVSVLSRESMVTRPPVNDPFLRLPGPPVNDPHHRLPGPPVNDPHHRLPGPPVNDPHHKLPGPLRTKLGDQHDKDSWSTHDRFQKWTAKGKKYRREHSFKDGIRDSWSSEREQDLFAWIW
ncbi:hypothetical protein ACOMHN_054604 [Nucella lapillus]